MLATYQVPGVYRQDIFPTPEPPFATGVPLFLGYAEAGPINEPQIVAVWSQFEAHFGTPLADGFLGHAVRGFFENGGIVCYVLRLDNEASALNALRGGLLAAEALENIDLVCVPDATRSFNQPGQPTNAQSADANREAVIVLQREVLDHCQRLGDRFAILDTMLTIDTEQVEKQRDGLVGDSGALYHPWLWVSRTDGQPLYVPPCGHIAGIYARTDQLVGVHKAPANAEIQGILDLRTKLTQTAIGTLYAKEVNSLQSFPGRGIRVWGARTLSHDPAWRYVNVRRVFLTVGRWVEQFMTELVLEPNNVRLWVRIMRELSAFLDDLFQSGALKGSVPEEAFYVKCDGETNPPEVRDAGMVVTQIGLALAVPAEFIEVRIIHGAQGVSIE